MEDTGDHLVQGASLEYRLRRNVLCFGLPLPTSVRPLVRTWTGQKRPSSYEVCILVGETANIPKK